MTITDMCPMCDGRGERPCGLCEGTRQCPACRGKGQILTHLMVVPTSNKAVEPCSWCNETGKCPQCKTGLVFCEYCQGTGEILVTREAGEDEQVYEELAQDQGDRT